MKNSMKCIWPVNKLREKNYHVAFVLRAQDISDNAKLYLAAENLYRVNINGKFAGMGPVRCAHGISEVDVFSLFPDEDGGAWICVEVTAYNISVLSDANDPPFFAAKIAENDKILYTSDNFKAYELTDAEQVVPRYSWQRHFIECYRMNKDRRSLYLGDTSGHLPLSCSEVAGNKLYPRSVGYPTYELMLAEYTGDSGSVILDPNAPIYSERYINEIEDNGFFYDSIEDSVIEAIRRFSYIKGAPSGESRYALFDLGLNLSGFIELELTAEKDSCVYILWDEILTEEGNIAPLRMRMSNALRLKLGVGHYRFTSMEAYTMRYIKIVTLSGKLSVKNVGIRKYENPQCARLQFNCADKRYEKLISAAQSTLAQNSTDIFMDCPSRERAGWLCDSYFMGCAEWLLSGENTVERHFLDNYSHCPQYPYYPEGMIPKNYPSESPLVQNFIPNWALWYIIELASYFTRTRDSEIIDRSRRIVEGLIKYFQGFENEYGLLEDLESWVFIEWSRANDFVDGVNFPSNMLYAKALYDAGELYDMPELKTKSEKLKKTIRELSLGKGMFYRDHAIRKDGQLSVSKDRTETCQYYAFFFGIATPESDSALLSELINKFGYYRDTQNVYPDVYKSNAFIGNLIRLCVMSKIGYSQKVMEQTLEFYLYMAEQTNTLWEYDSAKKSCCHGFASYIVCILLRGLVGLDIRIKNKLYFLDTYSNVDCSLKLPLGNDKYVSVTVKEGRRSISAPEGIETEIIKTEKPDIPSASVIPMYSDMNKEHISDVINVSRTSDMRIIRKARENDFNDYCQRLINDSYRLVSSNRFGKNLFATLVGATDRLCVSYHSYCDEIHVCRDSLAPKWIYDLDFTASRIKFAQHDTKTSYVDDIVGVACGMGYLFMLDDGSFVAIDGGLEADAEGFAQLMQDMCGNRSPHVRLWLITHPHSDHYGALKKISHRGDIVIDNYYSCMPPSNFKPQGCRDMLEGIKDYDLKNISAHTGDIFHVGGLKIETLLCCEEMILNEYEQTYLDTNNLSSVFKITVDGQSILFAADARTPEYKLLKKIAGDALKSDILQVTHHGRTGRAHEDEFVSAVAPTIALWPGNRAQIRHDCALGANNWILSSHSTVKKHIVANDGRFVCELPYRTEE